MGIDAPLPLSLFATGDPTIDAGAPFHREQLDDRCWAEHSPGWIQGGDELLVQLADVLPWSQRQRVMWGEWVDEPRLTSAAAVGDDAPVPILREIARALSARFALDFHSCFCNFYRGGSDSVAWHADRNGRTE